MSTWSDANNKYQDVVTNYLDNGVDFLNVATTENGALKSVEIITDCDNSNIELFSGKNYNIDIAIVKISLDFSNNLKLLDFKGNRPNTYQNYLNASSSQKQRDLYYDQNNLWETLPFALIWGGKEFGNNENKLGILPLVVDSPFYGVDVQYNIYENFKNELSKL